MVNNYNSIRCESHSRCKGGIIFYLENTIETYTIKSVGCDNELWILADEIKCAKRKIRICLDCINIQFVNVLNRNE